MLNELILLLQRAV